MGRSKTLPDTDVYAALRRLLIQGGDKAVAFSSVAQATGLAAPTLAQRYGTRDAMVRAALLDGWDVLDAAAARAAEIAPVTAKGAAQMLKSLAADDGGMIALLVSEFRDPVLRGRALAWRAAVVAALALRLRGSGKGRGAAAVVFAAWQGQVMWQKAGGPGIRVKDAVKHLA
jgi:AcrR family transcriptional regulator